MRARGRLGTLCVLLCGVVVWTSTSVVTASDARAQDLLLPEWDYEPPDDAGVWKRGAGRSAEAGWSFINDTLTDSWSITTAPIHWRWKGWLAAAAIAGATTGIVYGLDQRVRDASADNPSFERFGEDIRWVGNGPGLIALTGGFALAGFALDRPKERETARLLLEASAIGLGFTTLGKYTLGRGRPSSNRGPFDFDPFSGNASMPSGETTSAFIMAGVLTSQYPEWYVQITAYSLATAVGAGRIALDSHWTSDVFISAALGIAVSKAVVYFDRKRREERGQERRRRSEASGEPEVQHFFQVSPRAFRWTVVY